MTLLVIECILYYIKCNTSTSDQTEHDFDVSEGDEERGVMRKQAEILELMDEIDGTDDFYNMINEVERGE